MPITDFQLAEREESYQKAREIGRRVDEVVAILEKASPTDLKAILEGSESQVNRMAAQRLLKKEERNLRVVPQEQHYQTFRLVCIRCGACACEKCWTDKIKTRLWCRTCLCEVRIRQERNHQGEWNEV